MTIRAVLFDFSGTLFRLEPRPHWFTEMHEADGSPFDLPAQAELLRRMTTPVSQVVDLTGEYAEAWEQRDLDPEQHRKVYREVLRRSGVPTDEQVAILYGRLLDPAEWTPYPDTAAALELAAADGRRVGVLSNIAFDIRPAFTARGLDAHVDEFVLSYEVAAIKPDPAVFRLLLDRLGVAPEEALMVGDSAEADGGATELGCAFALVDHRPDTAGRPDGLLTALAEHGIG